MLPVVHTAVLCKFICKTVLRLSFMHASACLHDPCSVLQGKIPLIVEANNALGSIVAFENSLLAPLAPFGRKLHTVSTNGPLVTICFPHLASS